ncbi:hypothetical protein [Leptospira idonii]|uniref:Lipoprotein n=1 Tax=Leptospira idonii TaxID=1193500 RepID=A0A4R9LY21_9LEPT|nr:hypothetical protein [Leptospira idonii]TGN19190.1 hypothetical protein EHS15_09735 [Leptospira idonii]
MLNSRNTFLTANDMRKKNRTLFYVFSGILILQACSPSAPRFSPNPYASWSAEDPGLQKQSLSIPLPERWNERAYPLDEIHQKTLTSINAIDGFKDVPEKSSQEEEFKKLLSEVRATLPDAVNRQFDEFVYGIYFVRKLGSTGLTGIIRDGKKPIGGIIFLDTDFLNRKANDWASFKENTVFQEDANNTLHLRIEEEDKDTISAALSFILLHEFGHILAVLGNHAPDYSLKERDFRSFPFFQGIWIGENESEFDSGFFQERKTIRFYGDKKIRLAPEGLNLYRKLKNTPFVTLYSSTNADDTFADSYVSYVHVILQKKPYEIYLLSQGKKKQIFKNGITEENGRRPREFFDKIFKVLP